MISAQIPEKWGCGRRKTCGSPGNGFVYFFLILLSDFTASAVPADWKT